MATVHWSPAVRTSSRIASLFAFAVEARRASDMAAATRSMASGIAWPAHARDAAGSAASPTAMRLPSSAAATSSAALAYATRLSAAGARDRTSERQAPGATSPVAARERASASTRRDEGPAAVVDARYARRAARARRNGAIRGACVIVADRRQASGGSAGAPRERRSQNARRDPGMRRKHGEQRPQQATAAHASSTSTHESATRRRPHRAAMGVRRARRASGNGRLT